MALAADLSSEEHRMKMMAMIGISIGIAFAVSMVLGPVLSRWIGLSGLFFFIAFLAVGAIAILHLAVPNPRASKFHRDAEVMPSLFGEVVRDAQLLRLNFGVFALHSILTAIFVVVPLLLRDSAGLPSEHHWWVYFPVFLLAFFLMVPFIIIAEKKRRMKEVFVGAIAVMGLALVLLSAFHSIFAIAIALLIFFTVFNLLEASLPSLVAKISPPDRKGTAMGVYSSSQFIGAFAGGVIGGWCYGNWGLSAAFAYGIVLAAVWLLLALTMQQPRYLNSYLLNLGAVDESERQALTERLISVRGVEEAVIVPDEGIAYLKVDSESLDEEVLLSFSAAAK